MNAQTIWWFVLLALIKNLSCQKVSFDIEKSHLQLTAKEGSCIEIKCKVTTYITTVGAYWFWMKNGVWNSDSKSYNATIIYSSNKILRPVSQDFANRVTYIGSPSSSWNIPSGKYCSILICNLEITNSGTYNFRFLGVGELKWVTQKPSVLTVEENPCLITFDEPSVVQESTTITLTCSTLSSCPSNPEMFGLTQWSPTPSQQGDKKSTTVKLTVDWQDDGKVVSCQTKDNKDVFLIRNITLTVEYAPRDALAEISTKDSGMIKEGQTVTLTCSSKGRPEPTFVWYSKTNEMHSGAEWKFPDIEPSKSGEYHCKAKNKHDTMTSNPVRIDVKYSPQVEVEMTPSTSVVNQGDRITLKCNVKSSDPQPSGYTWLKDERQIGFQQTHVVESIQPKDSGAYRCRATNIVGPGTSAQRQIIVNYRPRSTAILISKSEIEVGDYLTFSCNTDAQPAAHIYSWYRNNNVKQTDSSQWKYKETTGHRLTLSSVQRADEACYICNATNTINTGENSEPKCIRVLYPPTKPTLSMDTEVREGHLITISCTVESFPLSRLTLTSTSISQSLWPLSRSDKNILKLTFNVTSTHAGFYTCAATNRIGSSKSDQRQLVVKYRPTDVTVQAQPNLVLKENMLLKLHCSFQANPQVTSVTWMKMIDGDIKIIQKESSPYFTVKSVSSSDSGLYSCAASNEIGTGNSTRAEVKVKYAPKHTNILSAAEQQNTDGTRSVMVSCSSHSYPPVTHYSWYMKMETKEGSYDEKVSDHQNYTVYSHQPGVYYCIAKNEINHRSSDPVQLFVERGFMKVLKFFFLSLIILLVIVFIFFVYRHKRNKSIRQRTTNPAPCCGFLGWRDCDMRSNFRNEPVMPEPFRSRDDLLPDQPCRPKAHRRQPHPDSTPDSNISTVYCTVQPVKQQGPSAQKPIRQQRGHTEDDSINYATLHFENKQKKAKAEPDVVYSTVFKKNPPNKNEQESMADYENISTANAAKSPNPLNYDTDTSEDEVEVNYSQVSFKAKPGHQRESSDSSTSDEEETQFSQVKI